MELKIGRKPKEILAQKVLDLANIGAGAILFGQFIAERKFVKEEAVFAFLVVVALYGFSFRLLKGVK